MMLLRKIKYRLQLIGIQSLFRLGFFELLSKPKMPIVRILVFHGIDHEGQTHLNSRFISAGYFEQLLTELQKKYNFISLDDLYLNRYDKAKSNLVVTFDDGLQNNVDLAIPLLEKLNIPATFFITTAVSHHEVLWPDFLDLVSFYTEKKTVQFNEKTYIKNKKHEFEYRGTTLKNACKHLPYSSIESIFKLFDEEWQAIKNRNLGIYWQLMSFETVKRISQHRLISVGAHSVYHTNLTTISDDELEVELKQCKRQLELATDQTIHQFAFPFGTYSDRVMAASKNAGFTQMLALDFHKPTDIMNLNLKERFMINPHIGWKEQLYYIKKGGY